MAIHLLFSVYEVLSISFHYFQQVCAIAGGTRKEAFYKKQFLFGLFLFCSCLTIEKNPYSVYVEEMGGKKLNMGVLFYSLNLLFIHLFIYSSSIQFL